MLLRIIFACTLALAFAAPAQAETKRLNVDRSTVQRPPTKAPACGVPRPRQSAYCVARCRGSYKCAKWKLIS